jgi:MFS family permease
MFRRLNLGMLPVEYRGNFLHLIADIAWFGVLNGSSLSFLTIYAARVGATTEQIGWINAAPALMSLLFALPAGAWLEQRHVHSVVVRTAIAHRLLYLFLVILPLWGATSIQPFVLIGLIFFFYIPGAALSVSFNALFAETVPADWRAWVAGMRNAAFAVATIVSSLICGYILNVSPFPTGYVWVFLIGVIGAAMSTVHLYLVRVVTKERYRAARENPRPLVAAFLRIIADYKQVFHFEILRTPFRHILLIMLGFHLAQYLPIPLFPIYTVKVLGISDQYISLGNALFFLSVFVGSTQLVRITRVLGNRGTTGLGLVLLSGFPALLSIAHSPGVYLLANLIGGAAWSLAGGALFNYLLERVPEEVRGPSLAWFNVVANAGALIGSLAGPLIGQWLGLSLALLVLAGARFLMGWVIIRWG